MFLSEFRDWWRSRGSLFGLKPSASTQSQPNVTTIEDDYVQIRVENNSDYRLSVSLTSDKIPKSKCVPYQARTQVNVTFDQSRRTITFQCVTFYDQDMTGNFNFKQWCSPEPDNTNYPISLHELPGEILRQIEFGDEATIDTLFERCIIGQLRSVNETQRGELRRRTVDMKRRLLRIKFKALYAQQQVMAPSGFGSVHPTPTKVQSRVPASPPRGIRNATPTPLATPTPPKGIPPPPKGIPQPPPPPPGVKGPPPPPPPPPGFKGPPPPPPPPGGRLTLPQAALPFGLKRTAFKPPPGLYRPHWAKLEPTKLTQTSFWASIKDDRPYLSADLEALLATSFAPKPKVFPKSTLEASKTVAKSGWKPNAKGAKKCRVLDDAVCHRMAIVLKKISAVNFIACLLSGSTTYHRLNGGPTNESRITTEETLGPSLLQSILDFLPNARQRDLLAKEHQTVPLGDFTEAERFAIEISPIPQLQERVASLLFKVQYTEWIDARKEMNQIRGAIWQLKRSPRFGRLLALILAVGNYLNAGGAKGGAVGFELASLPKLGDTKTTDNRRNLVAVLVSWIREKEVDTLKWTDDLACLEGACKASEELVKSAMESLRGGVRALGGFLEVCTAYSAEDRFKVEMEAFLGEAKRELASLEEAFRGMNAEMKELATFYTFELAKYSIERCFGDLKQFADQFKGAIRTMDDEAAKRVAAEKQAAWKKKAQLNKSKKG